MYGEDELRFSAMKITERPSALALQGNKRRKVEARQGRMGINAQVIFTAAIATKVTICERVVSSLSALL
ncbi:MULTISPECIES: hypothetical protein [unclassified Pantoea]|uniref:hypothetical protein n=1 Tax=unclassified Pantoea TaxID=2630326 RepID=UPI000534246F|nr:MULTISPECIES: hypothetical protein [unclassified Pantoea]MDU6389227.1 hypothetical protein [Pantoea sp.]